MQLRDPFKGCWDRYDRAIAHRDAAFKLWSDFLDQDADPYSVQVDMDQEGEGVGRGVIRVFQDEPLPELLPILFGEYFYNLRAALDYAVYATAVIDNDWRDPPPGEGILQFPICETPESWGRSKYHVGPLSERHRDWIESVQPYVGGDNPKVRGIYWLNELARLDRHRELRIVGANVAESSPVVLVKAPAVIAFDPLDDEVVVDSEDGAVIARFTVTPWQAGDKVEANPQASLAIEFRDFFLGRPADAKWLRLPLGKRLFLMESVIHSEVGRLEYDCIGRTRSKFLDKAWVGFKKP